MTKQEEREFRKAQRQYKEYRRKEALKSLFRKTVEQDKWYGKLTVSGWDLDFTELPLAWRIFYWFKSVMCLLFRSTNGSYLTMNSVTVTFWNNRPATGEYSGYDWEALWVEPRIFKNWRVCISSDSSY